MKTKLFTLFLAVIANIGTIFAEDEPVALINNLYYRLNEEKHTALVCGWDSTYTPYSSDIIIPSSIDCAQSSYQSVIPMIQGIFSVIGIVDNAFKDEFNLTSVKIPYSITSIGKFAFDGCSSLTSIEIPNSVTSIEDRTFCDCNSLTSIEIPNNATRIGAYAFAGCRSLTSIEIPSSVTVIGQEAFGVCPALETISVDSENTVYDSRDNCNAIISTESNALRAGCQNTIIPNSVTSIGNQAFYGCSSLTSIEIPNSVTSIGSYAFYGCSGLTSVSIGNGVTEIKSAAFSGCSALKTVSINSNAIVSKAYTKENNIHMMFGSQITSYIIGDDVTSIGENAFHSGNFIAVALTSVTIGNGVTSIGEKAFYGCRLTSATIGNKVTDIGNYAFYRCNLTSIEIPNNVTSIGDGAFSAGGNLTFISIGTGVTSIGKDAFGCISLKTLEWKARQCEDFTFTNYEQKSDQFKITDGSISFMIIGEEVEVIPAYLCYGWKIQSISIPNNVTRIGESAFWNCTGLTSVTIGNGVTSIGKAAFANCNSVTSIEIPNNVTSIGGFAFSGCTGLTSVTIGNGITSIESAAFAGCTGLASITIPNNVTRIGESAFQNCTGLTAVNIGNKVTSIESAAFAGCTGLASITIPNNVTRIGESAFQNCTGLTSVAIGDGATDIGSGAFEGCSSLGSIEIPNNVTSIGENAFKNCTGLTSVTIGKGVTSIGLRWESGGYTGAFDGCTNLTSVTLNANAIVSRDSYNGAKDGIQYMFGSQVKNYILGDDITAIGAYAFAFCKNLTSVTIGNNVQSIGGNAFEDCDNLSSVTIGNSVQSIGNNAFWCCKSLTSIEIPDNVTNMGVGAFKQCTGLTSITIGSGVTNIGYAAFRDCIGLQSVHISDLAAWCTIEFDNDSRASNPLSYAHNLYLKDVLVEDLVIPAGVTSIGVYAFYECTCLTSVTIPNSVTSIGEEAFYGCTGLTSVTCMAATPPSLGSRGFNNLYYSVPLYVPASSIDLYRNADEWKKFKNILPISASDVETNTLKVEPSEYSVTVAWPAVSGAATYELVIKDKNGNVICTLIFNAQGQLIQIAFNAPANGKAPQQTQSAGFSFVVTGLDEGTDYDLTIIAKNESGKELDKKEISFHTNGANGIEDIIVDEQKANKILLDGQIYILRGDHVYDAQGKMVK